VTITVIGIARMVDEQFNEIGYSGLSFKCCVHEGDINQPLAREEIMPKTKVFVSYDHSEDAHYKRLLQAWDANPDFDLEFDSRGPNVAIDSTDAAAVKAALTAKMKTATHLLVLVGEKTAQSKWISWEIDRAKQPDVKLRLAAVKLAKANATPAGLLNVGTSWATSFERDRIVEALKAAKIGY
jgi:hypothetical protein